MYLAYLMSEKEYFFRFKLKLITINVKGLTRLNIRETSPTNDKSASSFIILTHDIFLVSLIFMWNQKAFSQYRAQVIKLAFYFPCVCETK